MGVSRIMEMQGSGASQCGPCGKDPLEAHGLYCRNYGNVFDNFGTAFNSVIYLFSLLEYVNLSNSMFIILVFRHTLTLVNIHIGGVVFCDVDSFILFEQFKNVIAISLTFQIDKDNAYYVNQDKMVRRNL